jgi:VanZ family protein
VSAYEKERRMSVINGLPAHILLVHLIVVLAPLTAVLAIVSAVWPAARRRLVWLVLALALVVMVTTPLTTEAGEWLEHKVGESPAVEAHAELGDTMLYFAIALLVAAALLVFLHVRESRATVNTVVAVVIAAVVVLASVATTVQVYRIGDSGSRAAWGDMVSAN